MEQVSERSVSRTKLTERERRLAEHVARGKSIPQAALAAGYSLSVAKTKAYKILKSHKVQSFLTEALERLQVTTDMIVQPIVDALKATKTVHVKTELGKFQVKTDEPDIPLRLEGFDRAERLYGATLTKHEIPPPPKGKLTVVIVRASDLEKARARQEQKAIEVNPKKTLDVSIAKKAN